MNPAAGRVVVRPSRPADDRAVIALSRRCYPHDEPWTRAELDSQRAVFPAGQLVAEDALRGEVVGMAASLVVRWDDYDIADSWRDFTDHGRFTNHDPLGRTLYGAEIMVSPDRRRQGVGSRLYDAREALVEELGLDRIRAGARLGDYARHAERWGPEEYVENVVAGRVADPTLSFQLHRGFRVLAVVPEYLKRDPASLGWAAVVEWRPDSPAPGAGG